LSDFTNRWWKDYLAHISSNHNHATIQREASTLGAIRDLIRQLQVYATAPTTNTSSHSAPKLRADLDLLIADITSSASIKLVPNRKLPSTAIVFDSPDIVRMPSHIKTLGSSKKSARAEDVLKSKHALVKRHLLVLKVLQQPFQSRVC
jgi:hypothetical protein